MAERRSLFQQLFGVKQENPKTQPPVNSTQFRLLNDYVPIFYNYSGNMWDSDIVRAAIHTISANVAKLKPNHVRITGDSVVPTDSYIDYMLQNHPNEYESSYDFLYKMVAQLMIYNNAFVYVRIENGRIVGFYNILYQYMELFEKGPDVYCKFTFRNAQIMTLPYSEIIHIRRHYQSSDFFGSSNNKALEPTLQVIQTVNSGIINSIKSSASLRGIIKFSQSMLKPEDLKRQRDDFITEYMNISNSGGVAALDSRAEFTPLEMKTTLIDEKTIRLIRDQVYSYYGVNESIVKSDFTEAQYQAFYENVVQPIAMQLGQEFTAKIFTDKEKGFGNQVIFEANHYAYMSTASKVSMVKELIPMGLLTLNEAREIFNLPNVDGGETRLQSLNYVDINKANEYQMGIKEEDVDEQGVSDSADQTV